MSKTLRLAIYERDGWTCGICDEQIDRAADYQDSWAATLDHITPRALGGTDTPDNLRAAHRWCNTVRGTSEWLTLEEVS